MQRLAGYVKLTAIIVSQQYYRELVLLRDKGYSRSEGDIIALNTSIERMLTISNGTS